LNADDPRRKEDPYPHEYHRVLLGMASRVEINIVALRVLAAFASFAKMAMDVMVSGQLAPSQAMVGVASSSQPPATPSPTVVSLLCRSTIRRS
jgi:hypothetical protein